MLLVKAWLRNTKNDVLINLGGCDSKNDEDAGEQFKKEANLNFCDCTRINEEDVVVNDHYA